MKKIILLLIIISSFTITGCNKDELNTMNLHEKESENIMELKILINDKEYVLNLEDNDTVKEFINILPKSWVMSELNGNEKYVYLEESFATNSYNPKTINQGDVMLYGNNCLVIFYKTFNTSYSYTKIGHINNLDDLGNESIKVMISK